MASMDRFCEIYSAEKVAKYFKIHPHTVRGLARKKKIPAFKFGGQWRFREEDISEMSKPCPRRITEYPKSY